MENDLDFLFVLSDFGVGILDFGFFLLFLCGFVFRIFLILDIIIIVWLILVVVGDFGMDLLFDFMLDCLEELIEEWVGVFGWGGVEIGLLIGWDDELDWENEGVLDFGVEGIDFFILDVGDWWELGLLVGEFFFFLIFLLLFKDILLLLILFLFFI